MEVLHHLRPQRRRRVRQTGPRFRPRQLGGSARRSFPLALVIGIVGAAACGGDQRVTETADSAVSYGAAPFDSARVDSSRGSVDTSGGNSADTATGDSDTASPEVVLLADSVAGREIYNGAGTCFTCHALDGAGVTLLGSSLRDSAWTHIDGSLLEIIRVIRDGIPVSSATRRGMPAFGSRLSDAELYRLAAYTYTLSHPGSAVADTVVADSATAMSPDTSTPAR